MVEKDGAFEVEKVELEDDVYYEKALSDEKESNKCYPGLKELRFSVYSLNKLTQ